MALDLGEYSAYEHWLNSVVEHYGYTLEKYFALSGEIQQNVEAMYLSGEFYKAIDCVLEELDSVASLLDED